MDVTVIEMFAASATGDVSVATTTEHPSSGNVKEECITENGLDLHGGHLVMADTDNFKEETFRSACAKDYSMKGSWCAG